MSALQGAGAHEWSPVTVTTHQQISAADWKLVSELLREGLSPEQISGRLGLERRLEISHESRNDRYRPTRGTSSGHWEMDTIVSSGDRHCVVSLINV